jgi:hypothetical protein
MVEQFWRDGVVVVEGFVDEERASTAADELSAVVASHPDHPYSFAEQPGFLETRETFVHNWTLASVAEMTPSCAEILTDPRLDEVAVAIVGPDYRPAGGMVTATAPGCGQAWHQDTRDPDPRHFTLNRIVFPSRSMEEAGRLLVVPGSHREGDIASGASFDHRPGAVPVAPSPGALVLMHSRCWHAVEVNRSGRSRVQFNARVLPADCPEDVTLFPMFTQGPWNFRTGLPE